MCVEQSQCHFASGGNIAQNLQGVGCSGIEWKIEFVDFEASKRFWHDIVGDVVSVPFRNHVGAAGYVNRYFHIRGQAFDGLVDHSYERGVERIEIHAALKELAGHFGVAEAPEY